MIEKYLKKHAYGISKNHKSSKNSQQNYSETVTNENDKEIPKERYISLEETQKIIDNFDIGIIV